jgi:hypothetical protein
MNTVKVIGHVDEQHRLTAQVPSHVMPGPVEVLLVLPPTDEDAAGQAWMAGLAHEWAAEVSDPREDIYTLEDGEPVDGPR